MDYDVCIGSSTRSEDARVLLTVTEPEAARALEGALNGAKHAWLDGEGLRAFVRQTRRRAGVASVETSEGPEEAQEPADEQEAGA